MEESVRQSWVRSGLVRMKEAIAHPTSQHVFACLSACERVRIDERA